MKFLEIIIKEKNGVIEWIKHPKQKALKVRQEFSNWSTIGLFLPLLLLGTAIFLIFTGFYHKVNFSTLSYGVCTVIWAGYLLFMLFGFIGFLCVFIDRVIQKTIHNIN